MNKVIYLIILFLLLLVAGCKDDNEDMQKYSQAFLGQWQEIARGNEMHPELTPDGHVIEFLPDGTMSGCIYMSGTSIFAGLQPNYRVDAEFLYLDSEEYPDEYTYRYTFTGADALRLDLLKGGVPYQTGAGTFYFHIYERLTTNEP